MQFLQLSIAALVLVSTGVGMALYERSTIRAGRPLLAGRNILVLYWTSYLTLIVLGLTAAVAAVLK